MAVSSFCLALVVACAAFILTGGVVFLVFAAATAGGLTVIANAPNPAGYSILNKKFSGGIVSPLYLFLSALGPTIVAIICYKII